ncbi:MAG: hypothetical protein ACKOET_01365 [Verrucomicrobiota bacterium]
MISLVVVKVKSVHGGYCLPVGLSESVEVRVVAITGTLVRPRLHRSGIVRV